jgi:hypothetical protein
MRITLCWHRNQDPPARGGPGWPAFGLLAAALLPACAVALSAVDWGILSRRKRNDILRNVAGFADLLGEHTGGPNLREHNTGPAAALPSLSLRARLAGALFNAAGALRRHATAIMSAPEGPLAG